MLLHSPAIPGAWQIGLSTVTVARKSCFLPSLTNSIWRSAPAMLAPGVPVDVPPEPAPLPAPGRSFGRPQSRPGVHFGSSAHWPLPGPPGARRSSNPGSEPQPRRARHHRVPAQRPAVAVASARQSDRESDGRALERPDRSRGIACANADRSLAAVPSTKGGFPISGTVVLRG
jgi:hypothetical protein